MFSEPQNYASGNVVILQAETYCWQLMLKYVLESRASPRNSFVDAKEGEAVCFYSHTKLCVC